MQSFNPRPTPPAIISDNSRRCARAAARSARHYPVTGTRAIAARARTISNRASLTSRINCFRHHLAQDDFLFSRIALCWRWTEGHRVSRIIGLWRTLGQKASSTCPTASAAPAMSSVPLRGPGRADPANGRRNRNLPLRISCEFSFRKVGDCDELWVAQGRRDENMCFQLVRSPQSLLRTCTIEKKINQRPWTQLSSEGSLQCPCLST